VHHLLLVDDDRELGALLAELLAGDGFAVELAHDGQRGLERAVAGGYALVILDVMLPGLSGFEVLRKLREGSSVPVIMLTARGDDVDRIVGLEMGADDYLAKPFNPRELTARIRAVLRRAEGAETMAVLVEVGDVRLDSGTRTVTVGGVEVELTGVEFTVLESLLHSLGQVVERDELSRAALGRRASSLDRSLDVHVSNLRRKLGPTAAGGERIKTVRGVGYQYVRPPAGAR
jgi:two-component system, OmpR family, response regulator CpxR